MADHEENKTYTALPISCNVFRISSSGLSKTSGILLVVQKLPKQGGYLYTVSFLDDAWFYLSVLYLNSQNMVLWSLKNPHFFEEPLHPKKGFGLEFI